MRICFADYDGVMTSMQEGSYFPEDVNNYKMNAACARRLI